MEPTYGAVLTIDGEVYSDEAIVIVNGSHATAYVWSDETTQTFYDEDGKPYQERRDPGNEIVAQLDKVTEEKGGKIVGISRTTGQHSEWLVKPGRRCKGCP